MLKSNLKQPTAPLLPATTNSTKAGAEDEQQQTRRRTAIRIVGIEGIEILADLTAPRDAAPRKEFP